ncbi:MAG: iron-sulfur cluster assembly protein [Anaerolineae bacterium]|nr:iron-sulfur cluster assembly protein [Anaerolineae bacterium]
MPTNPLESQLLEALRQLKHPEIESRTLGALGMIQAVRIEGNQASVTVALPLMQATVRGTLVDLVRQAAREVDPALDVAVEFAKMTPEARAAFMAVARAKRPPRRPSGASGASWPS